jgi:hypothetical protein
MDYALIFNPIVISIVTGLVLGAGLLFLLSKYALQWLTGNGQTAPSSVQALPQGGATPRRTLAGLSWIIATTHSSVSKLIGLVMSFASLIAIVLSVICAVAGIAIISYQKYGSLVLSLTAAFATLILATIIENISINALKSIRLANEEIAQAEQAHYEQIVKQMEEQFEGDAQDFAKINHQTLSKEEVESMKRAASLKLQARKQFERKRHTLMKQQTRTARRTRNTSIPFAIIGVLFSASAGGLFWHTVLASLELWLNLTIGTMFALAVSVTFVQSELLKRIKDEAIKEALQSGEMQSTMLKQQSEDMVLEMVVDTMAAVKADPATLIEMGTGIKEELKTTIRMLTQQTTSRLVDDADNHPGIVVSEVAENVPQIEEKAVSKRQRKEPEWLTHPALSEVLKRYPKLNEKVASWRSTGRVSISIVALINATNHSKRVIQNRIKDGTLRVSSHNTNLVLITSVIDWLRDANMPSMTAPQNDPITEKIPVINESSSVNTVPDQNCQSTGEHSDENIIHLPSNGEWVETLSITLEALRANPEITEEELAVKLGMKALGLVRFWKVKARQMLEQEQTSQQNGHTHLPNETVNLDEYVPLGTM